MIPIPTSPVRKAAIAFCLAFGPVAVAAASQDLRFRDGRFLETVAGVTLQRVDEASSDEAVRNMPFLPGDRVWTDQSGRAEIVFAEGEILWIAERSKVDSLGRGGPEQDERLGLRVFAGSFGARVRSGGPGFEFRAPGGSITTTGAAAFRVDVRAGETTVSVSEGEVLANLAGKRMTVRTGERVRYAERGVDGPAPYQRAADQFDRWYEVRAAQLTRLAGNRNDERLPDELDAYGDELEENGEWVYDEPQGYVFVPRVHFGWAPYTYGRWAYTLYGWTWVADEPWGFVTSHYGRWGYSPKIGWHWMPRSGFAGAWVAWSTPVGPWNNTVGWCALGFNDRPVGSLRYGGARLNIPGSNDRFSAAGRGWSFVDRSQIGRANIDRHGIEVPIEEADRAVIWNAGSAPDREFRGTRSLAERATQRGEGRSGNGSDNAPRIYVRPSPGDSTPELRSDPTTTIPSPESRRGRTIGQDGFKTEQNNRKTKTRLDTSNSSAERTEGSPTADSARPASADREAESARQESANDDARGDSSRDQLKRDPLLNRLFRSITSLNKDGNRDTSARDPSPSNDDGSARRKESPDRDGSSVREATPRPRPAEASAPERDRPRPTGAERSQPRSTPKPQASPRGNGSEEGQAERRRPPTDH